jgi:hypothetical protein
MSRYFSVFFKIFFRVLKRRKEVAMPTSKISIGVSPFYTPSTPEEIAEIKIGILYDFCCLNQTRKREKQWGRYVLSPDPLEDQVRAYLLSKKTESAMQAAIIDVITGRKTIHQMLERK